MGCGPLIAAGGILLLLGTGLHTSYLTDLLPGLLIFAVGLSMTVAPLTATVLASADESDAGIASAVNNAVARIAGLIGVSMIGVVVAGTLSGNTFAHNEDSVRAFHQALVVCAALVAAGGLIGLLGIANPRRVVPAEGCPGGQLVGCRPHVRNRTNPTRLRLSGWLWCASEGRCASSPAVAPSTSWPARPCSSCSESSRPATRT
jgi:hypothetical protein